MNAAELKAGETIEYTAYLYVEKNGEVRIADIDYSSIGYKVLTSAKVYFTVQEDFNPIKEMVAYLDQEIEVIRFRADQEIAVRERKKQDLLCIEYAAPSEDDDEPF